MTVNLDNTEILRLLPLVEGGRGSTELSAEQPSAEGGFGDVLNETLSRINKPSGKEEPGEVSGETTATFNLRKSPEQTNADETANFQGLKTAQNQNSKEKVSKDKMIILQKSRNNEDFHKRDEEATDVGDSTEGGRFVAQSPQELFEKTVTELLQVPSLNGLAGIGVSNSQEGTSLLETGTLKEGEQPVIEAPQEAPFVPTPGQKRAGVGGKQTRQPVEADEIVKAGVRPLSEEAIDSRHLAEGPKKAEQTNKETHVSGRSARRAGSEFNKDGVESSAKLGNKDGDSVVSSHDTGFTLEKVLEARIEDPRVTSPKDERAVQKQASLQPEEGDHEVRQPPPAVEGGKRGTDFRENPVKLADMTGDASSATEFRTQFVQRVMHALRLARQHDGELRLRLHPPELGMLRLEMRVEGGVVTARLEAESALARDLLLENLPDLRQRLAEHRLRVDRFDVSLMMQSHGEGHNPGYQAPTQRPAWGIERVSGNQMDNRPEETMRRRLASHKGAFDVLA